MTDDTTDGSRTDESPANQERTDQEVIEALDDHAIRLATTDPVGDPDGLDPLRDLFADSRVIGLGEATHGTREFFRLKHRLVRYLVTELDARVFCLEANFPETLALDDYVVHGVGDPREALEGTYFWTWTVESVLELVEWIREFNANRPLDDRVRFYGMDTQYASGAVDALTAYLDRVDPDYLAIIKEDLASIDGDGVPPHQDDLDARIEAAERVVPDLRDRLQGNRATSVAATSESEWDLARQYLRVLDRATEYRRAIRDLGAADGGSEARVTAMERALAVRDRAMADAVDWILDREDPNRLVLWGHDAHVNRVEHAHRGEDAAVTSLGGHLADHHGDDYCAVGFAFGHGGFQAVGPDPDADPSARDETRSLREHTLDGPLPGTVEATLSDLDTPVAVLDVRSAREDPRLAGWITRPRPHLSLGATYDPGSPSEYVTEYVYSDAFDALCYVDETSRARPLDSD